jgi:hypothetical protein
MCSFQCFKTRPVVRQYFTAYYELYFTTWARAAEVGPVCDDFSFYAYKLMSFKDIICCDG